MVWRVEILDKRVERELDALAVNIRQGFLRIVELIELSASLRCVNRTQTS